MARQGAREQLSTTFDPFEAKLLHFYFETRNLPAEKRALPALHPEDFPDFICFESEEGARADSRLIAGRTVPFRQRQQSCHIG